MAMRAGGIEHVTMQRGLISAGRLQKVGPLTNVSLKHIALMDILFLGPPCDPSFFRMTTVPLAMSLSLSALTVLYGIPAPTLKPIHWPAHLTCFPLSPHHLVHTTPSCETVLSFAFIVCLHKKQCTTLTGRKAGAGHADTFVLCWLWGQGTWPKAQRKDSWMPVPNGRKGHFWLLPPCLLTSQWASYLLCGESWIVLGLPWQVGCLAAGWPSAHSLYITRG